MYPFNDTRTTAKKSKGTNTKEYLIIHHTAGGSFASNMKYLSEGSNQASVHFVIGESEERGKI
jgi:N-acetylmuramoyl-L-alanine amidase CwlA